MKNKRIHDKKLKPQADLIRDKQKSFSEETVHFSFKHLDVSHDKFSIHQRESVYFKKMLARLKDICLMKKMEIINAHKGSLRAHPINWGETSEPKGFSHLNEQLQQTLPYQFQISSNEHGRVHGFFIENIFFIVWFDPDHKLYPGK